MVWVRVSVYNSVVLCLGQGKFRVRVWVSRLDFVWGYGYG